MYKRQAKQISYSKTRRSLSAIKYNVIHYSGNNGDTAKNNADYFATGNTRAAGAHYFVDRQGEIAQSVSMYYPAWSVGGDHRIGKPGEAAYYKECTNANSVSIELCDCATKDPSDAQIEATKRLIKAIQAKCPNAKTIIRHYDVNGKLCPARMCGSAENDRRWNEFLKKIQ